jgi:hypothetical protein
MRVGISSLYVDPVGAVLFDLNPAGSDTGNYSRRVTRTKTLDGGVALFDGGYAEGDRTIQLEPLNPSEELTSALRSLFKRYGAVLLFLEDGAYRAAPQNLFESRGRLRLTLLIEKAGEVVL